MSMMTVTVDAPRAAYRPGDEVTGQVGWDLPGPPARVELRLAWTARGGGQSEGGIGASVAVDGARSRDARSFTLTVPDGPCSYHGRGFDLQWRVEVVSEPGGWAAEAPIVIGPSAAVTTCPPQPLA